MFQTQAPRELPSLFDSWQAYYDYLVATPLRGRWYIWNPHYRIGLRTVIAQVRAKLG